MDEEGGGWGTEKINKIGEIQNSFSNGFTSKLLNPGWGGHFPLSVGIKSNQFEE